MIGSLDGKKLSVVSAKPQAVYYQAQFDLHLRPFQGRWVSHIFSGGVATLNPRLMALIPSGSGKYHILYRGVATLNPRLMALIPSGSENYHILYQRDCDLPTPRIEFHACVPFDKLMAGKHTSMRFFLSGTEYLTYKLRRCSQSTLQERAAYYNDTLAEPVAHMLGTSGQFLE